MTPMKGRGQEYRKREGGGGGHSVINKSQRLESNTRPVREWDRGREAFGRGEMELLLDTAKNRVH